MHKAQRSQEALPQEQSFVSLCPPPAQSKTLENRASRHQKGGPRSRSELRFGALDGDPPRYSTELFTHLLQLHGQVQVDHLENWGGEGEGAHDAVIAQSQRASSHIRRHLDSLLVGNGLGMVFGFGRA